MTPVTTNRLTVALAVGLLIVLATVLGLLTSPPQVDFGRRPSTFFTDPTGARALWLTMQRLLPEVELWRRPFLLLPVGGETNAPGTLLTAGPGHPLSRGEADRLATWLAEGGQLILLSDDGWPIDEAGPRRSRPRREAASKQRAEAEPTEGSTAETEPASAGKTNTFLGRFGVGVEVARPAKTASEWPLTRAGAERSLELVSARVPGGEPFKASIVCGAKWTGPHTVFASADTEVVAVEIPHERGRIIALADPGFVSNRALRESDNAVWLLQLCAAWPGPVRVDEYHHGFGQVRGATELTWSFLRTPWGWCALQLLAAGALYSFLYRRRMGRICEPSEPGLRSAADLVEARAGLFRAAGAHTLAADLMVQQLCHTLGAQASQPAELLAFCQRQRQRHATGRLVELFDELERLYRVRHEGNSFSDQALLQLGQVAGQIYQVTTHER